MYYLSLVMFCFQLATGIFASTITQVCEIVAEYSKRMIQKQKSKRKSKNQEKSLKEENSIVVFSVTEEVGIYYEKEIEIIQDVTWYKINTPTQTKTFSTGTDVG